ncbi:MAG: CrcB family protein [Candidatus Nanopelagicales bacterium]
MLVLLITALAGGLGGAARFLVDTEVTRHNRTSLPMGTVVVNTSACLFLGLVTGYALTHTGADDVRTVIGVGLLGGYSTFSTASVEGYRLLRQDRWLAALIHSGGMLVACLVVAWLGLWVGGLPLIP